MSEFICGQRQANRLPHLEPGVDSMFAETVGELALDRTGWYYIMLTENRIGWRMEKLLSKSSVYCVAAYYIFLTSSKELLTSSLTPVYTV
jgi:hypothetical protein